MSKIDDLNKKDWRSTLVSPGARLEEAVAAIENSHLRIAIVVNESGKLIGTLTDGDVRRALLKHLSLDVKVESIMCSSPKSARLDWSRERILSVMENDQLLQVPIVDSENRVIGLESLDHLVKIRQLDNPVFIMAGGFGTRLQPLTHDCPKPLLKVGGKAILEIIIQSFIDSGFRNFFISTHYLPEMIREYFGDGTRWGISVRYVHEESPLGSAGALGLLPHDEIDLPLLMMNGDLLTTLNHQSMLAFHNEANAVATVCVREYEHQVPFGVIRGDGLRVCSIVEKPVIRNFINAGIYILSPDLVKSVTPQKRIDMPDLLERAINQGKDVRMFPLHEYWLDVGRMEDFQRAQVDFAQI